jgi:hypothetical protein
MTQSQITDTFLQAFVGGRFESEKRYPKKMPRIRKGEIRAISLESGIITIPRIRSKDIEIVLSTCEVSGSPLDERITFESSFDGHTVSLRIPKK